MSGPHMHEYHLPYLPNNRAQNVPRHLPSPPSPDSIVKPMMSSKKGGTPKGKGAVRAKSGCYTCRIRRKKCDETQDESGSCQTCLRLRLECLGFGAKRPDWMRENNSVPELREKIKQFLASQGMIKGHSGAGSRASADGNPGPILLLSETNPSSGMTRAATSSNGSPPGSPQSPPSATTTTSSHHYPSIATSDLRSNSTRSDLYSPLSPDTDYHSPGPYTPLPSISSQSSLHTRHILHPVNEPTYSQNYVPTTHSQHVAKSSGSSVSPTNQLHHPMTPLTPIHNSQQNSYFPSLPPLASRPMIMGPMSPSSPETPLSPPESYDHPSMLVSTSAQPRGIPVSGPPPFMPHRTRLSQIYTTDFGAILKKEEEDDAVLTSPTFHLPHSVNVLADSTESSYMDYYLKEVLNRQYLLADGSVGNFLWRFSAVSEPSKDAMCLLSALHMHCMRQLNVHHPQSPNSADHVHFYYRKVKSYLKAKPQEHYDEGDAMAGLHIVSSFLFTGGRGPWDIYLDVAMDWLENKLSYFQGDAAHVLLTASEPERFIMRTTFWFDVWASITQQRQPRFLDVYRRLYGNPYSGFDDDPFEGEPTLNMINIVGCTNKAFRAMAEIATLSVWKDDEMRMGRLSARRLVERGDQIESEWLPRQPVEGPLEVGDDLNLRRHVVADVFGASARVYLNMVLSKGFPECPEIKDGVEETIMHLKRIDTSGLSNTRAVVRSVIFAICLCGCLTEDDEQKQFFMTRLDDLGEEANVLGNCNAVKSLMQSVWTLREQTGEDVDWRQVMKEGAIDTLLLV